MASEKGPAPVLTCTHVLYGWSPVLVGSYRDGDGALQLLCSGHPHDGTDYRLVPMRLLLARDRSLVDILTLPRGARMERRERAGEWQRRALEVAPA